MLSAFTPSLRGIIVGLIGFLSFAAADTCAKWLGMRYETASVIFWTYLICLILGLIASPFLGGIKATLKTPKLPIHIARGVCSIGIAACVIKAMSMGLPQASLYTILFLAPFLTALLAWPLYKEPVPAKHWGIIALGFAGTLIALRPGIEPISLEELYAFAALGFVVILGLLARPLDERESLHSLSFYPALITLIIVTPFLFDQGLSLPESMHHWFIYVLGAICVLMGLSGIAHGFRIAPYSLVAPLQYSEMVFAVLAGYILFNDQLDLWTYIGSALIILSGIWLVVKGKHH